MRLLTTLLLLPLALSSASPMASSSASAAELAQLVRDLDELYWLREAAMATEDTVDKRGPAFSSWAGKRAAFSSWAGKRNDDLKRAAFSSWAGKRNYNDLMDEHERAKRNSDQMNENDNEFEGRRVRRGVNGFSAWGGKREEGRRYARNAPNMRVVRPNRAAFSAWGGR